VTLGRGRIVVTLAPPPEDVGRRRDADLAVVLVDGELACLAGDPRWFWLLELSVLSVVLGVGIGWLRAVERRLVREWHA
jgi:hypothetical protein